MNEPAPVVPSGPRCGNPRPKAQGIDAATLCAISAAVRSIPSAAGAATARRFDKLIMVPPLAAECGGFIEAARQRSARSAQSFRSSTISALSATLLAYAESIREIETAKPIASRTVSNEMDTAGLRSVLGRPFEAHLLCLIVFDENVRINTRHIGMLATPTAVE